MLCYSWKKYDEPIVLNGQTILAACDGTHAVTVFRPLVYLSKDGRRIYMRDNQVVKVNKLSERMH